MTSAIPGLGYAIYAGIRDEKYEYPAAGGVLMIMTLVAVSIAERKANTGSDPFGKNHLEAFCVAFGMWSIMWGLMVITTYLDMNSEYLSFYNYFQPGANIILGVSTLVLSGKGEPGKGLAMTLLTHVLSYSANYFHVSYEGLGIMCLAASALVVAGLATSDGRFHAASWVTFEAVFGFYAFKGSGIQILGALLVSLGYVPALLVIFSDVADGLKKAVGITSRRNKNIVASAFMIGLKLAAKGLVDAGNFSSYKSWAYKVRALSQLAGGVAVTVYAIIHFIRLRKQGN